MVKMTSPLLPEDPQSVGDYKLLGRLGSGATGVVYEAFSRNGDRVAVKVLHAALANASGTRERLRREGVALQRVSGARAVRVLEVDADGPKPFLAMDLVEGQTLDSYIASFGRVRGAMLWGLAEGLVEALTDVHAAGIVHRDLKPSNVLLGPQGVRVVDFGISVLADATSLTGTGSFVGTAAWLSPEQVLGEPVSEASDVFAFGLVLGYAATGKHVFGDGRSDAIMYRIVHSDPQLDGMPQSLRSIISGCLKRDVASRLTLSEVRALLGSADREISFETDRDVGSETRVVDTEEQIRSLIGHGGKPEVGSRGLEVLYDIGEWDDALKNRLQIALQDEGIRYVLNYNELVIHTSDESRVDELIREVHGEAPIEEYPGTAQSSFVSLAAADDQPSNSASKLVRTLSWVLPPAQADTGAYWNKNVRRNRNIFVGILAGLFLIGAVVAVTENQVQVDLASDSSATSFAVTTSTSVDGADTLRLVGNRLSGVEKQIVADLNETIPDESFSEILRDKEQALLMTDLIQADCRGKNVVNEVLYRAGFRELIYDNYFSNYLGDQDYPDSYLVSKVSLTVLGRSLYGVETFESATLSVLGGREKVCIDNDHFFYTEDAPDLMNCARVDPAGSYGIVAVNSECATGVLRSVPWETDTSTGKSFKLEVNSKRLTPLGDLLVITGRSLEDEGTVPASLMMLVWVDPSERVGVVLRAHALNYRGVVSQELVNERMTDVLASAIGSVFGRLEDLFGALED